MIYKEFIPLLKLATRASHFFLILDAYILLLFINKHA
jgi:hypothetical protein